MPVQALSFISVGNTMEKSRVKRCLFGRPDHNLLRKDLDEQLKATESDMKLTWNWDTIADRPLDGRYEWTMVKQEEDIPSFYLKGYRPTKFRKVLRNSESESDLDSVSSSQPMTPIVSRISGLETQDIDLQRENETTPELRPQRQTRIDDHFVKVKRSGCKRRLSCSSSDSDDDRKHRKLK